jgi:hypothetical protein
MFAVLVPVLTLAACSDAATSPQSAARMATERAPSAAVVDGVNSIVVKSDPTKCVSVRGGHASKGAATELAICDGSAMQQFAMQSNGEIRLANTTLCLDAFGGAGKDGDVVGLWSCKGYNNQKWSYNISNSSLTTISGNKCLDAYGESLSAGTSLIIWACHGRANQQWLFTSGTTTPPPTDTTTAPTTPSQPTPPQSGPAQAFPGAVGFGAATPAGRGGAILRVTNLNDGGAGSLRAALTASGARTVICEISGTIALASNIVVSNPYLTFAGQTCPAPGLLVRNYGISIRTHDVLLQHLRVRVGAGTGSGSPDAIEVFNQSPNVAYNVVIDHVSASWGRDENLSTWIYAHDVTFSHILSGENFGSGEILLGDSTQNVMLYGSITAHSRDRAPYVKGATTTLVVNNLFYNYLDYPGTYMSDPENQGPEQMGVQGNRYLPGPNSNATAWPIRITGTNKLGSKLFVANNARGRNTQPPADPWSLVNNSFGSSAVATTAPIWPSGFSALDVMQVYDDVLAKAGACPNWRDAVDQRLISDIRNGTGTTSTTSQSQVGGFPTLAVNTRPLTPPANPSGDDDGDGYTNLEEWLHSFYAACGGHN